jgi:hypothetical protein
VSGSFAAASLALLWLVANAATLWACGSSRAEDTDGSLLDSVERVRHVMQQRAAAEVAGALRQARAEMTAEPDAAMMTLTAERERVRLAPELDPARRDELLCHIDRALAATTRQSIERGQRVLQQQELLSEQDARRQASSELVRSQLKAEQSIAHVNALASQGRYRDAEDVARSIRDPGPVSIAASASLLEARTRGNIADVQALAERTRQGRVEAFHAQDTALVPISDDPGIVYPAADKWRALTERRRKWGELVSLYRPSPGEEKIYKALRETTSIDFENTPLADAIEYLKAKHDIEIQLDNKGLVDAALEPSAPVTRKAKGIKLRSALRLVLDDLDLTYVVQDDVLTITSKDKATEIMSVRVYPVADLMTPLYDARGRHRRGW